MTALSRATSAAGVLECSKLSALASLTAPADVVRLLHEVVAHERAIEADLDRQLERRGELERSLLLLNASTTEVRCPLWLHAALVWRVAVRGACCSRFCLKPCRTAAPTSLTSCVTCALLRP